MALNFNKFNEADASIIMIVDALNMAFRWMGKTGYHDAFISMVESLKKSYKASKVIITADKGTSSYRKNILPEYKLNRKEKYENQTEAELEASEAFFNEFNKIIQTYVDVDDYPVFRFDKCEADDIAAYIVKKYSKTNTIWLMSSDGDWDLLVGPNVSRFSYVTRKEITVNNWRDKYDYDVDDHISIKCLTGDSGDNIPGVPGIGPKKAAALVQEYGTTYDIIASMPINSKYKHIHSLNEFGADNLIKNYKLMDLITYCDEALGEENCKIIDKKLMEYING